MTMLAVVMVIIMLLIIVMIIVLAMLLLIVMIGVLAMLLIIMLHAMFVAMSMGVRPWRQAVAVAQFGHGCPNKAAVPDKRKTN